MEPYIQEVLSEQCERPQHLRVDQWSVDYADYTDHADHAVNLWIDAGERLFYESAQRKYRRRLEKWWHKPDDTVPPISDPNEKLADAKKRHFTPEGKAERVARSLAALSQPTSIRLTTEQWRRIAQDADMEDQF